MSTSLPLLSLLIALPAFAAVCLPLMADERRAKNWAVLAIALQALLAMRVVSEFDFASAQLQLNERHAWIPSLGAYYAVGVDGLSVLLPFMTVLLTGGVILASWRSVRTQIRLYLALLLLLDSATIGVFCAVDLLLFFLFWELTLIPLFFLISLWGSGPSRRHAAAKYLVYMLAGGVPLLFGIILLALNHAQIDGAAATRLLSFDLIELMRVPVAEEWRTAIFWLLFIGFAVKAPLVPFHSWLPSVALEGPTGVAALLTGLKLGVYGIIRLAIPLAPEAARNDQNLLLAIGAVTAVYGALLALRQFNLRSLLAYASISHVGMALVGIASFNIQGLQGALVELTTLPLVSGGLFIGAGFLLHRTASTDLANIGGLAKPMPRLTTMIFILGSAAIGVPGTSGFVAENLILLGAFSTQPLVGTMGLLVVILSAGYFLGYFQRAFLGPVRGALPLERADLNRGEWLLALLLTLAVVITGLAPSFLADMPKPAAIAWVSRASGPIHSFDASHFAWHIGSDWEHF